MPGSERREPTQKHKSVAKSEHPDDLVESQPQPRELPSVGKIDNEEKDIVVAASGMSIGMTASVESVGSAKPEAEISELDMLYW